MFYYILPAVPCAVKFNGAYLGKAGENYSIIDAEDGLLELLPVDSSYMPITYLIGKSNVKSVSVKDYDLGGGRLIIPIFGRRIFSDFRLIGRKSFPTFSGEVYVTCYAENGIRLICENRQDMHIESVLFYPETINFERITFLKKEYLLVFLSGKRTMVIGYSIADRITLVFKQVCDTYRLEGNVLYLTETKKDVVKHVVITAWQFGSEVSVKNLEIHKKKQVFSLNEKLLPYAFFEEIGIKGDVSEFLTAKLMPRAKELVGFLGEFTAVLPPPHFKDQNLVLLLYRDFIKFGEVKTYKGLIDNVSLYDADEI